MIKLKTMEEELNYVTVTFKPRENPNDLEIIYQEVNAGEQARDAIIRGNENRAPPLTPLHLAAAGLGITCVVLASAVIALSLHLRAVLSEQSRRNTSSTAQGLLLWEERTEALTKERDGLNWTISVILQYENFPVNTHCPQKVCKPCLDGWKPFQSNCYLFHESDYYSLWMTWQDSRDFCRRKNADLVVIKSQEEQEFISNHTTYYNSEWHGYWIGLSKQNERNTWMWVDGSNLTVMHWRTEQLSYEPFCVLSLPHADGNWQKASCTMRNRFICETRALIKPDGG